MYPPGGSQIFLEIRISNAPPFVRAFGESEINIGRGAECQLRLTDGNVSKFHARLIQRDGRLIVADLRSTNGTFVNGRRVTQATIVRTGDTIYIGDCQIRIVPPQAAVQPSYAAPPPPGPAPGSFEQPMYTIPGGGQRGQHPQQPLPPPGLTSPSRARARSLYAELRREGLGRADILELAVALHEIAEAIRDD